MEISARSSAKRIKRLQQEVIKKGLDALYVGLQRVSINKYLSTIRSRSLLTFTRKFVSQYFMSDKINCIDSQKHMQIIM